MSNKEALRELQQRLAQRMQAAREQQAPGAAWLAVECGGQGLLFSLKHAAEIFAPVPLKPLPYAKPWMMGVANLRGGLFTVVDLAVFLGLRAPGAAEVRTPSGQQGQARLVSLNPEMNSNCALLVDRLAGLRSEEQLKAQPLTAAEQEGRPRFAGQRMLDAQGRSWQQVHLDALSKHEQFLQVVV
ncbi:twitching motility protein PilI [Paucibacter oligotrophus]|uniref:Twitching motility protein PilI n=1 Tax=Roseateles oligotrophus TaxID=1769250 RepID=A0A840LKA4_9BURK|nr:chemotaxis protein CheW [Roseateles oligotrophus]MBB4845717.1 twitching motility protein PilI [Roseateles oligotrophus]